MQSNENLVGQVNAQRVLLEEARGDIALLSTSIDKLTATVNQPVTTAGPTVDQLIRNGDIEHSWDTHENAVSAATDVRFEAWEIFTHAAPVAAQQLHEDSVFSGVAVANSFALPDAGRSDTPNVDPDWSRSNGYARLGSTKTIDFPLPENRAFPGRLMFVSFIAAKRSANVGIPGNFFAGIWDNTAGKRNWLPASNFTITSSATVGAPVGTVSRDYKVVGYTDYGRTIESVVVTVANAPNDASFISGRTYVKLAWSPIAGVIRWEIYRKTGAVYVLLPDPGAITTFFDQGAIEKTVAGYPVSTATNQQAYAETARSAAGAAVDAMNINGVAAQWSQYDLVIAIPSTYDKSGTSDKQWLRLGFTQALTGADATRGVLIDLVTLSYQAGSFANSTLDQGKQQPISAPNGSSQGGAGTGGSGFTPPGGGSGDERCLTPEMLVLCVDEMLRHYWLRADALTGIERVVSPFNGNLYVSEIERVTEGYAEEVLTVSVIGGKIRCSASEPIIQTLYDHMGVRAELLKCGHPILIYSDRTRALDVVPCLRRPSVSKKGSKIIMLTLRGEHKTFIARSAQSKAGITIHNVKQEQSAF